MANAFRQRQIHLDFHTSQWFSDVGADFNARDFAQTMKLAHVNSVTTFAKCCHGYLYFDTAVPARHPGLKKGLDLTTAQVDALHAEDIRAPLYISVLFDDLAGDTHPEWIARNPDGSNVGSKPLEPGWHVMDLSSPYQEYLAEQVQEVLTRFKPVDGIFFDICYDVPSTNPYAMTAMLKQGFDPANPADRARFAHEVSQAFMKRFYRMVIASSPKATVYFNSRPMDCLDTEIRTLTHVEIEALPTGGWGYTYFPKNVRYARTFGKPTMGMTARFHRSWGDFGGLKPYAALKYEVSQMLSLGAACSIGDQLHPRGKLDPAAYDLIGKVYGYAEACEPWTQNAKAVSQIGLFMAGAGSSNYMDEPGGANEGAVRMLTQLKHQFDVVTAQSDLSAYALLILPDSVAVDAALAQKLRAYLDKGGSLLFSGASGLGVDHQPVLTEAGVTVEGESPHKATYIRFGSAIQGDELPLDHVLYERGWRLRPLEGAETLAEVVEPYFERNYRHYTSHVHAPPLKKASGYAAVVRKGRVITIAAPIFKAYGSHAALPYRQLVQACINLLMPDRLIEVNGPSTMEVSVMHIPGRKPATVVHLLQFVADHRAPGIDMIEDINPVYDTALSLRLEAAPKQVYLAPSRQTLEFEYVDGRARVVVPVIEGHQMVVFA